MDRHITNIDSSQVNRTARGRKFHFLSVVLLSSLLLSSCSGCQLRDDRQRTQTLTSEVTDALVSEESTQAPTPTVIPTLSTSLTPIPTVTEDMVTDTDGDKLPDYYEKLLGTDPALADTDKDGLSDYDEVILLGFNPLSSDSDNDGISDYDMDVDSDGLSFREESQYGTYCYSPDTDQDGLKDGDEINTYQTDPLLFDTDGDKLSDGDEIFLGLDPKRKDTDSDGTPDNSEKVEQAITKQIEDDENPQITEVTVSMTAQGNVVSSIKIKNMFHIDVQTSDVPGLIGVPVEFSSASDINEATITFSYDDSKLGNTDEDDLAIMWFSAEIDEYIVLDEEDVLDTDHNTIRFTATQLATYLVVDKAAWYAAWAQALGAQESAHTQESTTDQFDSSIIDN
jgi:hypothetical protein